MFHTLSHCKVAILEYQYRTSPLTTPTNLTVYPITIPLIYLLGVNPSVLIYVTDIYAIDPCLVSDMEGALIPFPKAIHDLS